MKVYRGAEARPSEKGAWVSIGVFDGVHLGHQAVLRELTARAAESPPLAPFAPLAAESPAVPAGVVTFANHPRRILTGKTQRLLTSLEHRLRLFERGGLAFAWVLDFTPELSRFSAREFLRLFLRERLGARGLVMGFDSCWGCDRLRADSPEAKRLAAEFGLGFRCVSAVLTPDGRPVGSTRIREAIAGLRLPEVEEMLGRRFSAFGRVVRGEGRGRRLGYPTVNLGLSDEVRPPYGVYAAIVETDEGRFPALTNVGFRPTVKGDAKQKQKEASPAEDDPPPLVEAHLLDYAGDLYGRMVEVEFVARLREERRFPSIEALVARIKRDERAARKLLASEFDRPAPTPILRTGTGTGTEKAAEREGR